MLTTILSLLGPWWKTIAGVVFAAGCALYAVFTKKSAQADVATAQADAAQTKEAVAEGNAAADAQAVQSMKNAQDAADDAAKLDDAAVRAEARSLGIDRGAAQ